MNQFETCEIFKQSLLVFRFQVGWKCRFRFACTREKVLEKIIIRCGSGGTEVPEFSVKPFAGCAVGMYQRLVLQSSFSVYCRMKSDFEEPLEAFTAGYLPVKNFSLFIGCVTVIQIDDVFLSNNHVQQESKLIDIMFKSSRINNSHLQVFQVAVPKGRFFGCEMIPDLFSVNYFPGCCIKFSVPEKPAVQWKIKLQS